MIFVVGSSGSGGPSASDAILTVTVPTGSTVTMTKGGVTLTPTMWVQAADNTLDCALFVISPSLFDSVNPWTVTATLGTNTASDTVTIDSNKQYDLTIYYFPPQYQRVEYIQSNGNQVINLGIKPTLDMIVKIKLNLQDISARGVLGAQWVASGGFFLMTIDSKFRWHPGAGIDSAAISTNTDYTIIADNNGFSVNGVLYAGTPATQMVSQNISVFQATTGAQGGNGLFKLYYLTLSNSGGLVRNLCPCYRKSDSVAGMYDIVNDVFYTNSGTGTFVVGPDV